MENPPKGEFSHLSNGENQKLFDNLRVVGTLWVHGKTSVRPRFRRIDGRSTQTFRSVAVRVPNSSIHPAGGNSREGAAAFAGKSASVPFSTSEGFSEGSLAGTCRFDSRAGDHPAADRSPKRR